MPKSRRRTWPGPLGPVGCPWINLPSQKKKFGLPMLSLEGQGAAAMMAEEQEALPKLRLELPELRLEMQPSDITEFTEVGADLEEEERRALARGLTVTFQVPHGSRFGCCALLTVGAETLTASLGRATLFANSCR